MRRILVGLSLAAALQCHSTARADVVFETRSLATQTITSPLFGGAVVISAPGTQRFTLDLDTGQASVTSDFQGTDLPDPLNPGGFLSYDLYNTATTGTVAQNASGDYDVSFFLLFELAITSGLLDGQRFATFQAAEFTATDIVGLPFPAGTIFSDPSPPDTVTIFAATSLPGVYAAGDPVGTSSGRTVTVLSVVPEPSSLALLGVGGLGLLGLGRRRRRASRG